MICLKDRNSVHSGNLKQALSSHDRKRCIDFIVFSVRSFLSLLKDLCVHIHSVCNRHMMIIISCQPWSVS